LKSNNSNVIDFRGGSFDGADLLSILLSCIFFILINIGVQASLRGLRLIQRALTLTTIQAFNDPEIYETRTDILQETNLTLSCILYFKLLFIIFLRSV